MKNSINAPHPIDPDLVFYFPYNKAFGDKVTCEYGYDCSPCASKYYTPTYAEQELKTELGVLAGDWVRNLRKQDYISLSISFNEFSKINGGFLASYVSRIKPYKLEESQKEPLVFRIFSGSEDFQRSVGSMVVSVVSTDAVGTEIKKVEVQFDKNPNLK